MKKKDGDCRKGLDRLVPRDGAPISVTDTKFVDPAMDIPPTDTFCDKDEWVKEHEC